MSTGPRRIVRATAQAQSGVRGGRGTGVIMGASRPMVPAQYVPEELISQAQVVLQGRSRNLIIRELQRTNLDVNLAVNNLLSRDDEDVDDGDDGSDSYVPEDLISLLDAGISVDHPSVIIDADAMFSDDMFGYSSRRASRGRAGAEGREGAGEGRELRWRDRHYSGPRKWLSNALLTVRVAQTPDAAAVAAAAAAAGKKKDVRDVMTDSALDVCDALHWWPGGTRFTHIAALHSELVAVDSLGQLHQWRWADKEPWTTSHPRAAALGLTGERITALAACGVRASVATESGKVNRINT